MGPKTGINSLATLSSMPALKLGLAGAALLGAVGAVAAALSLVIAFRLVHPSRARPECLPKDSGLAAAPVRFQSDDGLELAGLWMPAGQEPRNHPTVIFLHGYTQAKECALDVAPFLIESGYNLFTFDFRAHGESAGSTATLGTVEIEDARAAVRCVLARPDLDPGRGIHLLGWSQGGAMAIMLGSELPQVTSVISDSAFATLRDFLRASIPAQTRLPWRPIGSLAYVLAGRLARTDFDLNSAVAAMPQVRQPVLLIQGMDDPYTIPANVDRLAAAGGEQVQVWKVPGAGHLNAVRVAPIAYRETLLSFLAGSRSAGAGAVNLSPGPAVREGLED